MGGPPKGLKLWLLVARAPFFQATIIPVLLGGTLATSQISSTGGSFSLSLFLTTLLGALLIHGATNMFNDYFDFRSGNDLKVSHRNPFAGGGRILPQGLVSPNSHFTVAASLLAAGSIVGLYLVFLRGVYLFWLGLIGVICSIFYVGPPIRFAYRGLGEFLVGVNFGPVVVLGTYYVQLQRFDLAPLAASIPVGILIAAVLWINEFPDLEPDLAVGKRTLVARLGLESSRQMFAGMLILAYLLPILFVLLGVLPVTVLLALLTLPLVLKILSHLRRHYSSPNDLVPANAHTIILHLVFGLLFTAAIFFGSILNL